jgi:hypothetical protein
LALGAQPVLAGILLGILAFKPQFVVLIPIALVAGRQWRALLSTAATVSALVVLSYALFGWGTWKAFEHVSPLNVEILQSKPINWHLMPTVYVMMRSMGLPSGLSYAAQLVAGLTGAYLVFRTWRGDAPILFKGCVLILATFLATPYAWDYDMVVVTIAVVFFLKVVRREISEVEKLMGAILILSPLLTLLIFTVIGVQIGPIVFFAALLVAARRALQYGVPYKR